MSLIPRSLCAPPALPRYKKAEEDKTEAVNNPDLHQNRATVHEYLEDYHQAIEGCAVLGPRQHCAGTALGLRRYCARTALVPL